MSLPTSTLSPTQHSVSDIKRPCAKFAPSIWGDFFLQYASESMEVNDNMKQTAQILKEEVKTMFQPSVNENIMKKLNFIDLLQRFGVSYQFELEINQELLQIYNTCTKNNVIIEHSGHHFHALLFRLLRQQGYRISSGVFNKLKNGQGNFKETLFYDIQGLCSLYEAGHLRTYGDDDILEEICDFSNAQLKTLANQLNPSLASRINHCLRQPLSKSIPRFEARYHMTLYEQDPSHNQTLLTFAKADFNILQKMHQKEIASITKWWRKSNFVERVSYARERLVESYLWSLAMSYKHEHRKGRMFTAKVFAVLTLLDDAYGTIQELELFTEAFQRWDISLIESLPECIKVVFDTLVKLCEEMESLTAESGKSSFVVPYLKHAFSNVIKGYMVEVKWCHEGYIPTYDEYKANGFLTTCVPLLIISFTGPEEFATEEVFNWIVGDSNIIIEAASVIGRFLDDLASHKFEQQREHVASIVECCMKQYQISQAEAYNLIQKDVEDCWKVINEQFIKPNDIPMSVLECVVNLARSFEFLYGDHQDKITNGELLKDYVSSLLVDPMSIDQNQ